MNAQTIMDRFFYRKNPFAVKTSSGIYIPVHRDVTLKDIEKHLNGKHTIGAYQSRPDETCTWACIDFDDYIYDDVAQKIVRSILPNTVQYMDDLPPIVNDVVYEPSESKGSHVWFFFSYPKSTKDAYDMLISILKSHNLYTGRDSKIDIFPRAPHLSGKRVGWLVRIPR